MIHSREPRLAPLKRVVHAVRATTTLKRLGADAPINGYVRQPCQKVESIADIGQRIKHNVERLRHIYGGDDFDDDGQVDYSSSDQSETQREVATPAPARRTNRKPTADIPGLEKQTDASSHDEEAAESDGGASSNTSLGEMSDISVSDLKYKDLDLRNFNPKTWITEVQKLFKEYRLNFYSHVDTFKGMKLTMDKSRYEDSAFQTYYPENTGAVHVSSREEMDTQVSEQQARLISKLTMFRSDLCLSMQESRARLKVKEKREAELRIQRQKAGLELADPSAGEARKERRRQRMLDELKTDRKAAAGEDGESDIENGEENTARPSARRVSLKKAKPKKKPRIQTAAMLLDAITQQQGHIMTLNTKIARMLEMLAVHQSALKAVMGEGGPSAADSNFVDVHKLIKGLRVEAQANLANEKERARQRVKEALERSQNCQRCGGTGLDEDGDPCICRADVAEHLGCEDDDLLENSRSMRQIHADGFGEDNDEESQALAAEILKMNDMKVMIRWRFIELGLWDDELGEPVTRTNTIFRPASALLIQTSCAKDEIAAMIARPTAEELEKVVDKLDKEFDQMQAVLQDIGTEHLELQKSFGVVAKFKGAEQQVALENKKKTLLEEQRKWKKKAPDVSRIVGGPAPEVPAELAKVAAKLTKKREEGEQAIAALAEQAEQAQLNRSVPQPQSQLQEPPLVPQPQSQLQEPPLVPQPQSQLQQPPLVPQPQSQQQQPPLSPKEQQQQMQQAAVKLIKKQEEAEQAQQKFVNAGDRRLQPLSADDSAAQDTDEGWRPARRTTNSDDGADNTDEGWRPARNNASRDNSSATDDTDEAPEEESPIKKQERRKAVLKKMLTHIEAGRDAPIEGQTALENLCKIFNAIEAISREPLNPDSVQRKFELEQEALTQQVELLDRLQWNLQDGGRLGPQDLLLFEDVTNLMNVNLRCLDLEQDKEEQDPVTDQQEQKQSSAEILKEREKDVESKKKTIKRMHTLDSNYRKRWETKNVPAKKLAAAAKAKAAASVKNQVSEASSGGGTSQSRQPRPPSQPRPSSTGFAADMAKAADSAPPSTSSSKLPPTGVVVDTARAADPTSPDRRDMVKAVDSASPSTTSAAGFALQRPASDRPV